MINYNTQSKSSIVLILEYISIYVEYFFPVLLAAFIDIKCISYSIKYIQKRNKKMEDFHPKNIAVVQAIKLIKELHCLCARFWWGGDDMNRKFHWGSWKTLLA